MSECEFGSNAIDDDGRAEATDAVYLIWAVVDEVHRSIGQLSGGVLLLHTKLNDNDEYSSPFASVCCRNLMIIFFLKKNNAGSNSQQQNAR